jgi:hypothetical protein
VREQHLTKVKNEKPNNMGRNDILWQTFDNILKGRSITISLADEDTERHFMGQQIYGIVKGLEI